MELKNLTGRTPVLDVGTLGHIKTGKIKVSAGPAFTFTKGEIQSRATGQTVGVWAPGRPAVGQRPDLWLA